MKRGPPSSVYLASCALNVLAAQAVAKVGVRKGSGEICHQADVAMNIGNHFTGDAVVADALGRKVDARGCAVRS